MRRAARSPWSAAGRNRWGAGSRPRPEATTHCLARNGLTFLPLQELAEQRLPVVGLRGGSRLIFAQELIEAAARIDRGHGAAVAIEPFLRRFETRPAGQGRIERHFLPFGMEGRLLQVRDLVEERIDEARQPAIAPRSTWSMTVSTAQPGSAP